MDYCRPFINAVVTSYFSIPFQLCDGNQVGLIIAYDTLQYICNRVYSRNGLLSDKSVNCENNINQLTNHSEFRFSERPLDYYVGRAG